MMDGLKEAGFCHPEGRAGCVKTTSVALPNPGVVKVVLAQKELQALERSRVNQFRILAKVMIQVQQQLVPRFLWQKHRRVSGVTRAALLQVHLSRSPGSEGSCTETNRQENK